MIYAGFPLSGNSEKSEGTACRIHGRMRVNKVKGDSFVVSTGKNLDIDGIFAHFGGISSRKFFYSDLLSEICYYIFLHLFDE